MGSRRRSELGLARNQASPSTRTVHPGPASRRKPDRPGPQSQSLSRGYGSNLPTSLTYIILSTRGFSPRRPAADMGTCWCESAVVLGLIFKVPPGTRGHSKNCCALCLDQNPFSLREDSRASVAYAEKTTLPRAPAGVSDSFRVATFGTRAKRFRDQVEEYGPHSLSGASADVTNNCAARLFKVSPNP